MSGKNRIIRFLENLEFTVVFILISVIILSIFTQVITRYVLNVSISWLEELARFCFVWAALYGGSIAYRRKVLHKFDIPFTKLSRGVARSIELTKLLLMLGLFGVIAVYGMELSLYVYKQFSPALQIRMTYVYLAIPVTMMLMFVYTLIDMYQFLFKGNRA